MSLLIINKNKQKNIYFNHLSAYYIIINFNYYFLASNISFLSDSQKVVLVFFIGGCTFAEISALRFLSSLEDCKLNNIMFVFLQI